MGSSVYTLPEVPTIGFESGRASSSRGARNVSATAGWSLKVSYANNGGSAVDYKHERVIPTNLRKGYQIRHTLKIVGREISITSRLDFHQSLVDLHTEPLLAIPVLGQLPKSKG